MAVSTLRDRLAVPDAETLERMGFDLARLRRMHTETTSEEFWLQRMGFDVERLRFYSWLVGHDKNPEYSCTYGGGKPAERAASRGRH